MDATSPSSARARTLVGNSLGGCVTVLFALGHPEKVDRLVLVDAAGYSELARLMPVPLLGTLNMSSLAEARKLLPLLFANPQMAQDPALAEALLALVTMSWVTRTGVPTSPKDDLDARSPAPPRASRRPLPGADT